jgi:integrase
MHDLGLRRGEVVALDLADLDLEAGTVAIVGKGKSEKTNVTLNATAAAALADWVEARGDWSGSLFVRLDRAAGPGHPSRLDAGNASRASKALGLRAGLAPGHQPPRAAAPGDHPGAGPGQRGREEGEAVQPPRQAGDPALL